MIPDPASNYESSLDIVVNFAKRLELGDLGETVCQLILEQRLDEAYKLCEQVLNRMEITSGSPENVHNISACGAKADLFRRNVGRLEAMLFDLKNGSNPH